MPNVKYSQTWKQVKERKKLLLNRAIAWLYLVGGIVDNMPARQVNNLYNNK